MTDETDEYPFNKIDVDLGMSLGHYDAFQAVKSAIAAGRLDEWIRDNESQSIEEWEEIERARGDYGTRLADEAQAQGLIREGETYAFRLGVLAGLRGGVFDGTDHRPE